MSMFHRREDGAVAVEFALVAIMLFTLLFGIIEFGITYSHYQVMVGAAREGARHASVGDLNSEVIAAINDHAAGYDISETPSIAINGATAGDPACDGNEGDPVEVSWTQTFDIEIAFLPASSVDVGIRGVFRCET